MRQIKKLKQKQSLAFHWSYLWPFLAAYLGKFYHYKREKTFKESFFYLYCVDGIHANRHWGKSGAEHSA